MDEFLKDLNRQTDSFTYRLNEQGKIEAVYNFDDDPDTNVHATLDTTLQAKAHSVVANALDQDTNLDNAPYAFLHEGTEYTAHPISGPGNETVLHIYQGDQFVTHADTGFDPQG